ncbi:hypothetical protein GPALN_004958 [Globodera pallida]|nr:hypothetical protein GPALN_004958 [Globodera pallida]
MIGMMNNSGMDGPVEFYAGRRDLLLPSSHMDGELQPHPLVFESTQKKLSYTEFGRRLVDGKPEVSESPQEMWQKAMLRATCTRAVREMLGEKRRKSSKLRQLIAHQSGSIRQFFGTTISRHRSNQQQQQQNVENVDKTDGPGKPDRMPV